VEEDWEQEQRGTRAGSGGSGRGGRAGARRRPPAGRQGFRRRPRICAFCADKALEIDYKQPDVLRRYLTDRGKIRPRRHTGACAMHQRRLSGAIKRARHLALLPFVAEYPHSA
jgi:small subunit ribosomal protein S18